MKKIDWHSRFVNAMKLELLANEKDLVFTRANIELIREAKEEPTMCEAINELFAEETKKEKERADAAIKRIREMETELGETKTELGETKTELGKTKTKLGEAMAKIDEMAEQLQEAMAEIARLKAAK
jgi:predicted  nucleic acid-binding Zn-ribbon protein